MEKVTELELGGAMVHTKKSGLGILNFINPLVPMHGRGLL